MALDAADLAGRQPRYELSGTLSGFAWQRGTLTAIASLKTSGLGKDLLANLHADGTFTGRKLEVTPLNPWDNVEGKFDFAFAKTNPRLRLSALTIQTAGAKWIGAAETQDSGQMVVKLADGSRRRFVHHIHAQMAARGKDIVHSGSAGRRRSPGGWQRIVLRTIMAKRLRRCKWRKWKNGLCRSQ